jgi:hypothetical protein
MHSELIDEGTLLRGMLVATAAEDRLNILRLAMSSLDKMLGRFPCSVGRQHLSDRVS